MIQITLEDDKVLKVLNNYLNFFNNTKPMVEEIGQYAVKSIQNRISTTKISPNGTPWAPMAQATILSRIRKGTIAGGLLNSSGALLNSISFQLGPNGVQIQSSAPYAGYLQNGTNKMPARAFMGWSPTDREEVMNIINRRLTELLK